MLLKFINEFQFGWEMFRPAGGHMIIMLMHLQKIRKATIICS